MMFEVLHKDGDGGKAIVMLVVEYLLTSMKAMLALVM